MKKQKNIIFSIVVLIANFISVEMNAQVIEFDLNKALEKYTFIKTDSNKIHNDSVALQVLLEKLYKLQSTGQGRVNVVHIGDSHLQADFFSGNIRQHFHLDFGNAGRGLIFPYRLANRSNEPVDYRTTSSAKWEYKRNVFADQALPIGLSGYTIKTNDTAADITVWLKGQRGMDYSMNKLTIFHERNINNYDFSVYDSTRKEIGYVNMLSKSSTPFTSVLNFDKSYNKFTIKPCPKDSSQSCAQIYGMLLENGKPGVLYDMIGVNGAEFRHYNQSKYFIEQMSYLNPDLVIVSLGTNEAFNYKGFTKQGFYAQIDSMITAIKKKNPGVSILLTTPGDSFKRAGKRGRVKNPVVNEVRNTIIQYAMDNQLAWWDWYAVCGGYGAMAKWYAAGMADRGRIHYSQRGYQIQGELFYKAMMKVYAKYAKSKM